MNNYSDIVKFWFREMYLTELAHLEEVKKLSNYHYIAKEVKEYEKALKQKVDELTAMEG